MFNVMSDNNMYTFAAPDVTLISTELRVERVDLQPFSVQISFPVGC